MAKQNKLVLETAFAEYTIEEQIGQGGAGRVFRVADANNTSLAIKVLTEMSSDKRRRFKNEIGFLAKNQHTNIVTVIDHGMANADKLKGPFYVMRLYDGSLREQIKKKIPIDKALKFFSHMLDGVEAAHLQDVTHRDLKPENFLFDRTGEILAVADFGIANFTQDQLLTTVETGPTQRMANFTYAAPEQREVGSRVGSAADIYSLGLILNELFTSNVPLGTRYPLIAAVSKEHEFLDSIVEQMIRQNPSDRPKSILEVKQLIEKYRSDAVSRQRISTITKTVIPVGEIDEPLAHEPPLLIGANWDNGILTLTLDRPVNSEWIQALHNMGNYTSMMGAPPERFTFRGATASVPAQEHSAQGIINYFKAWLPQATRVLKQRLESRRDQEANRRREELKRQHLAEEQRMRVNSSLKV